MNSHGWYQPAMLDETPATPSRLVAIHYTVYDSHPGQCYTTGQIVEPVSDRSILDLPLRWFDMRSEGHHVALAAQALRDACFSRIGPF